MQHILSLVRRCVEDYNMIEDGETVAVGVSGGKDSVLTLAALAFALILLISLPLCAKLRRGALSTELNRLGISKIALGHHYDDAVETFFMSLIFEGRLSCFQPVTYLDRTGITQIRPLLYCGESLIRHTARRLELPVVENRCPADGNTKRQEIKELIYELQGRYPGLKARTFGAMQRLPLPEWGPAEHRRRPLPEELEE